MTGHRTYGQPRRCPIGETRRGAEDGCTRVVRAGHLMCSEHWAQVPRATRTAVTRAWRRWASGHSDTAWDAYLTARADAVAAVLVEHTVESFTPDGAHQRETFVDGTSVRRTIDGQRVEP